MLLNSLPFLLFFPVVCLCYWLLPHKYRNIFLLAASYYFYLNWKPLYALILFFSSVTSWISGIAIAKIAKPKTRKQILVWCIIANLAVLFVFKYAGFASEIINNLLEIAHLRMQIPRMDILLPVGISFYIFQVIAYIIDVYRNTIQPERHFGRYALFVSFFPQLVAGPIERAQHLLPQFYKRHRFDNEQFLDGIQMMIWGYFMKLCIADRVASYVDAVFYYNAMHNGTSLLVGAFFFTFQIYCDFAGYSLIALGTAKWYCTQFVRFVFYF